MIENIISVVLVVGVLFAIISIPVGMFNTKVFQAINGTKCTGVNFIKAFIPFYNITFSRKLAYNSSGIFIIALIVCLILILFRIVALALVSVVPVLVVFSSFTTIAAILLYWLFYIINAVDFCRMFNCGMLITLCCIILAPVGYYMLSTQVLSYFRSVEDEVSGRFGT